MIPVPPLPSYQSLMGPFLALHEDGGEHAVADSRARLAQEFGLSDADREVRLPSGRARHFDNRVGWAVTYLYRAGLLERPRRSIYRITDRGRTVLQERGPRVDNDVLDQFEDFRTFRTGGVGNPVEPPPVSVTEETPEERIDAAYQQTRSALSAELHDRLMDQSPDFFEQVVIDVLRAMGYGGRRGDAAERLGGTGDEGFDGVIREDALGLDLIYLQAKRWQNPVGRPSVQGFVGALTGRGAGKGVFITTSTFSQEARRYVEGLPTRVILIDGRELADLMIDHDVGVSVAGRYELKKVDRDYFTDESAVDAPPAFGVFGGQRSLSEGA